MLSIVFALALAPSPTVIPAAPLAIARPLADVAAAEKQLGAPDQATVLAALDELAKAGDAGRDALVRAAQHANPYVRVTALLKLAALGEAAGPALSTLFARVGQHAAPDACSLADALPELILQRQLAPLLLRPETSSDGKPAAAQLTPEQTAKLERFAAIHALASVGARGGDVWVHLYAKAKDASGPALASYNDERFAFALAAFDNAQFRARVETWLASADPSMRIAALDAAGLSTASEKGDGGEARAALVKLVLARFASPMAAERAHALEALGPLRVRDDAVRTAVTERLADTDPLVRVLAARLLRDEFKDANAGEEVLVAVLADPSPRIRRAALDTFAGSSSNPFAPAKPAPSAAVLPKFVERLADTDAGVRAAAAHALGLYGSAGESALPQLDALAKDADADVRKQAEKAAAAIRKGAPAGNALEDLKAAFGELGDALKKQKEETPTLPRIPAGAKVPKIADIAAAETLFTSVDQLSVLAALDYLATKAGPAGLDALVRAIDAENRYVSVAAVLTLAGLGKSALPKLPLLYAHARENSWLDLAHLGEARSEFATLPGLLKRDTLLLHATDDGSEPAAEFSEINAQYAERYAALYALAAVGFHDPRAFFALYAKEEDVKEPALKSFHDLRLAPSIACMEKREAWRPAILEALASDNVSVRIAAIDAASYAWMKDASAISKEQFAVFEKLAQSKVAAERAHVVECLSSMQVARARVKPLVQPLLTDEDPLVRLQAARVLRNWCKDADAANPVIVAALSDPSPRIRRAAVLAFSSGTAAFETVFADLALPDALPKLVELLQDEDADVRAAAVSALPDYGAAAESALPKMRALLEDDSGWVRSSAEDAITELEEKLSESAVESK